MANATDTSGILRQNLIDAGCDDTTVSECMTYAQKGEWEKIASLMAEQKKTLLKSVHSCQKQIDCLDFLVFKIQKEGKK